MRRLLAWQAIAYSGEFMNHPSIPSAGQRLPSGTVTFLFTDIKGSTKLAREHPDTWEGARARHHAILRSAIEANHGHVFQVIGDSFSAAFHTTGDAPAPRSYRKPVFIMKNGRTPS